MTNIIKLEDHFGGSGADSKSIGPTNRLPECPDWLPDRAKARWPKLVEDLGSNGIINELDTDVLSLYCSCLAKYIELEELLDRPTEDGEYISLVQETKNGYIQESGIFTAQKSLLKPIITLAKQLGLTPPARIAMKTAAPGQEELAF